MLPVNGLTGAESNTHSGVTYTPARLTSTIFENDPRHSWEDVHDQVAGGNAGFVTNFTKVATSDLGRVMGYHNATELPIFDLLARQVLRLRQLACVGRRAYAAEPLLRDRGHVGRQEIQHRAADADRAHGVSRADGPRHQLEVLLPTISRSCGRTSTTA